MALRYAALICMLAAACGGGEDTTDPVSAARTAAEYCAATGPAGPGGGRSYACDAATANRPIPATPGEWRETFPDGSRGICMPSNDPQLGPVGYSVVVFPAPGFVNSYPVTAESDAAALASQLGEQNAVYLRCSRI